MTLLVLSVDNLNQVDFNTKTTELLQIYARCLPTKAVRLKNMSSSCEGVLRRSVCVAKP